MLSTIIAIIIALFTGTTPVQPSNQNPSNKDKGTTTQTTTTSDEADPAASAFGGIGTWTGE